MDGGMVEELLGEAVSQEYRRYLEMGQQTCKVKLGNPGPLFSRNLYDLSGERIRTLKIELTGDELYVIEGYLLLYRRGVIRIYRYDAEFNCTRVRSMESHLLTFLVGKGALGQRCRFLFYNVLLHLVKNNEKKYDAKLRDVMCYMCVDWLVDVRFGDSGVVCTYRNGESVAYDDRLRPGCQVDVCRKEQKDIECGGQKIRVARNHVEVTRRDRSFKNVLAIEGIRQYIALGCSLFLLTPDSVKVLSFGE